MSIVKSFKGYRPKKELVAQIASRPYDVLDSEEAKQEAAGLPYSFYHVIKPDIDLPSSVDHYASEVYNKGKENINKLITDKILNQDSQNRLYIYAQSMNGRTQYGVVGCVSVKDYFENVIKKHELTRPDKEEDRIKHVRISNFHAEPVFLAYHDNTKIDTIVNKYTHGTPEYDFTATDGISHIFWVIDNAKDIQDLEQIFDKEVACLYIADGHHRTAAAALVGKEKASQNPHHKGDEEYNFFPAVIFPASQLAIMDYNRVIKDLNGLSLSQFIDKLKISFDIVEKGVEVWKPTQHHNFAMYLDGKWFSLTAKVGTYNDSDPIETLDVTVLTKQVLAPILDIADLRTSKRIDFVGGIRGLGELKKRVDSGEMIAAFALYPVSMAQLMQISDTNQIMPPKTTWFEPKLRSGLFVHSLE